ncbi:uncharacterized protein ACB058_004781 isoform 2-T2 [Synchiropus picturatus]
MTEGEVCLQCRGGPENVLNSTSPTHLMTVWAVSNVCFFFTFLFSFQQLLSVGEKPLDMNLYRSFGNLMELWVAEQNAHRDSEWIGNHDGDSAASSPDIGTNLRTDSVDSGVETASSATSFPATPSSMTKELDTFIVESETDGQHHPVSPMESPLPSSSSSPHLGSDRAHGRSTPLHLKVERALQRTDRKCQKQMPISPDEVLKRQSAQQKRPTAESKGLRSHSLVVKRIAASSVPARHMSDLCRRPLSVINDSQTLQTTVEDPGGEEKTGLSPAFSYLEDVCQKLEKVAKEQMNIRSSQMEMESLQSHEGMQVNQAAHASCQLDVQAAEEELEACRRLQTEGWDQSGSEPQKLKHNFDEQIRKRSFSDTSVATLHLRKLNSDSRGQHQSIDHLPEEEGGQKKEAGFKKNWKLKITSLTRGDPVAKALKSHGSVSSERVSPRRRLSQLFRKTRRTVPA